MAAIKTEMPPLHAVDAGGGGGVGTGADNGGNADAVVSNGPHSNGSGVGDSGNNTISAAADSSDNQPGTPQPPTNGQLIGNNEQQQQQQQLSHNPYGMYSSVVTTTNGSVSLPHMYGGSGGSGGSIYATAGAQSDMQQQQQQQTVGPYPSYINSFEQFYQQQQQQHQVGSGADYGIMYSGGGNSNNSDYKPANSGSASGVRYHPYLNTPTSCGPNDAHANGTNRNSTPEMAANGSGGSLPLSQSSAAVSTTTNSLSPRVVSSSSPTSTSAHLQLSGSSAAGSPGGGCKLQCKKCGLMCTSDNELQEHITNVHGASPYGSSGYSSSPYIKEELSSGSQQQSSGQQGQGGGNPGELLDLDSQKMVYPPAPGNIPSMLHHPQQVQDAVGGNDPLHSMHSMQQRALPGWDQSQPPTGGMQEGLPPYMQQQSQSQPGQHQTDLSGKLSHNNQSPYYSPKQSPYHVSGGVPNGNAGMAIKQEFAVIKSEYPDSQNYVDKSFDPTVAGDMCQQPPPSIQQQQQQQMMPVSSSPAEFPSTTTGSQDPQQQYRGFEPPSSSSINTAPLPTKAASWKSNEARRPKTYNCTACNKWFTSSGHLKRHYNTTLHKNAVKSSGQPDPATLPISAHHHPARDPVTTTKSHSRRNNASAAAAAAAAAAQQQQPPAPVQPPEPPRSPPDFVQGTGMGQLSQYSASPSPTQQAQMNGMPYGANPSGYQAQQQQQQYLNQVQSSTNSHSPQHAPSHMSMAGTSPNHTQTVLNGHPNGLAGPSAQTTPSTLPSSHTRGLLNTTTTTITKSEPMEDKYQLNSNTALTPSAQLEPDSDMDQDTIPSEERDHSQTDMEILQQQQQQQLEEEAAAASAVAAEQALEAEAQLQRHRQAQAELEQEEHLEVYHQHLLEEFADQQRHFHNSTPMLSPGSAQSVPNIRVLSPLITSHQQYQEQLRRPQAMVDNIFSHMQPPAAIHMPANIMEQQYNIIPLGINTPPLLSSSMQLLQPQQPITTNTATTVNMGNIHMLHSHHPHHTQHTQQAAQVQQEQLVLPSMRNTLLNNTSIQSQLDTISTITTPQLLQPITTTTQQLLPPLQLQQPQHTTNTIPSFQQLQQGSELAPLEPTMTYHTIIGNGTSAIGANGEELNGNSSNSSDDNSEILELASLDPYGGLQTQQMITADGQILQFMPSPLTGQSFFTLPPRTTIREANPRSPQEGDLPPAHTIIPKGMKEQDKFNLQKISHTRVVSIPAAVEPYAQEEVNIKPETTVLHELVSSAAGNSIDISASTTSVTLSSVTTTTKIPAPIAKPRRPAQRQTTSKRRRSPSTCTTTPGTAMMPSGRIKCLECNKEFTKNCYLTQHNKSFHSDERAQG